MSLVKASSIFIIFITLMHPLTMIMSMPMQQQQQVKDIKIASSSSDEEDLISKTCNQTSYSDVCMATFLISNYTTSSSSSSHNTTIHDLAFISINATASYAANTSAIIAAILNGSTDFSDQCLSDCLEQYGDAVDELQESMVALESCDYETVNVKVSAAMTNSGTCEGGFQDEGVSSPLTERNELFFKLCSNSLAIVKLLV
ncbi:Pectinesterase protein [Dioscorea alata]|uniref:Pectinesterase protein n=1 Tax=Dioscorea alata TaxID=55571 RepID=A0ACB7W7T4_DIOAL|nr:Pectinesterase protein [Dioscorea alata]